MMPMLSCICCAAGKPFTQPQGDLIEKQKTSYSEILQKDRYLIENTFCRLNVFAG